MINRRAVLLTRTVANLLLFVIYVSGWNNPVTQNQKAIIRRLTLAKYPVEVSFKIKGQPVNAVEVVHPEEGIRVREFEGDRDWLKDLTIQLKNTSGKTITYLVLMLNFPEITKNGRTAQHQIHLGLDPDRKFQRAELRLAPNETIELSITEQHARIKTLVEGVGNVPVENVSKVLVDFYSAFFDDETLFEAGTMFRRNPDQNALPKWLKIDDQ